MCRRIPVNHLDDVRPVIALAVLLISAPAHAQRDALDAPLHGFTTAELARVEPLLDDGVVGLVELERGDQIAAVHLAAEVGAPPDVVRDVLADPSEYPSFMPAVSEVVEHGRHGNVMAFTWRWRTSIFTLGGDASLAVYSPPPEQRARGHRVVVERTGGDLGQGREVWRILPRGADRTLLLLSTRVDMRDANAITRQMANASRSISRSINLAMGFGMLSRARMEAERRAGFERAPMGEPDLRRPPIDLARMDPLLRRGDLLFIEVDGIALRQTSVATRLSHPEARVREIMLDPVAFTQALIAGSRATVRERDEDGTLFDWSVDLPLIGTGGSMQLAEAGDRTIHLDATGGALNDGRWRFVTQRLPGGATGVLGWAAFDVGSANFLLRAIVEADASLRPGLSAATELMMARALRIRLMRR